MRTPSSRDNAGANLSGRIPRRALRDTVGFSTYELLHAAVNDTKGRVRYGLNFSNLTDREYWTSSLGNRQLYPGEPFNVMVSIRIRTK